MRVSQGEPSGRKINLYHPELLNEHEEVVIYTRNEFKRTFGLISEQVDYITKLNMSFLRRITIGRYRGTGQ
jgi:transcriptional regulator CtsR